MTLCPPREAEQAVLGAVLLNGEVPKSLLAEGLRPEDFYRETHGRIYAAMLRMNLQGESVDGLTLTPHLEQTGEDVGGRAAVDILAGSVPAISHLRQYARIVREDAQRRRIVCAAHELAANPNDEGAFAELIDAKSRGVGDGTTRSDWLDGASMDPVAVPAEPIPAIPGFPFLVAGAGAIIVGPTGGGRSSLVQACAYDAARLGVRVAYLGSEVTQEEFSARAASLAGKRGDRVDDDLRERLSRVRYLDLTSTIVEAWRSPDRWVRDVVARFDVVVINPLSSVAAALDLDFDTSKRSWSPSMTGSCSRS